MTKFDLDTLKSLYKGIFDNWRKAAKADTNIGSNGDGRFLGGAKNDRALGE